jgi:hypothetical protein
MKQPRGFIALLSVLLVSAFLLTLLADRSVGALTTRDSVENELLYRKSINAAWTCVNFTLNRLSADEKRFEEGVPLTTTISPQDSCTIIHAQVSNLGVFEEAQAQVRGHSGQSYTPLTVRAQRTSVKKPFELSSWEER